MIKITTPIMSLAISVKFCFVSNMGLQVDLLWLDMLIGALTPIARFCQKVKTNRKKRFRPLCLVIARYRDGMGR